MGQKAIATTPEAQAPQAEGASELTVREVEPGWFDYPNAEKFCGLSRQTLWRAANRDELHVVRIGRAVRISRQELDRFMESHREEAHHRVELTR